MAEERNWTILNGNTKGDEEGAYTFHGHGSSVIDYIIANEEAVGKVEEFEVMVRAESSHLPLKVELRRTTEKRKAKKEVRKIQSWGAKDKETYIENTKHLAFSEKGNNEMVDEFVQKIQGAVVYKSIKIKEGSQREGKSWWDETCKREKKKLHRL